MPTPTIDESDLKDLAIRVWAKASKIKPREKDLKGNWKLTETQINTLPRSIPRTIAIANKRKQTAHARNEHLRKSLSVFLKAKGKNQLKVNLYRWIVLQWGGIQSHGKGELLAKLEQWRQEFASYNDEKVSDFERGWKNWNVSSWSKILAFADYKRFAILDARASIALNILLHNMGSKYVFYMPPSQNRQIHGAYVALGYFAKQKHPKKRDIYMRFHSYMALLRAIVRYTDAKDVMQVEMHLYSIAPKIAEKFWADKKHLIDNKKKVRSAEKVIAKNIDEDE